MALYEHVFMARQDASPAQVEALVEQFKGVITAGGGKVGYLGRGFHKFSKELGVDDGVVVEQQYIVGAVGERTLDACVGTAESTSLPQPAR